jgi:ribonucleoside-diphosphate reductase alpha chain
MKTQYQQLIHLDKYARWNEEAGRRETWEETVKRYIHFWVGRYSKEEIDYNTIHECETAILSLEVMPSMRAIMSAGPALERDNVAGYNCSYLAIDRVRAFDELMYILMCGTGVGYSVEEKYVSRLPTIPEELFDTDDCIVVADSKIGWARAYRALLSYLYSGLLPKWSLHKLRPAGARLKTFGGRSSGPAPLDELFKFTVSSFTKAKGRKLSTVEVHDLVCKIADIVVVGGVRRSALISLSDLSDDKMRNAKTGQWWESNPQRALANNSVCYTSKPDMAEYLKEWISLYRSRSGERGIFNREGAKIAATRSGRRSSSYDFGTNPCSEIILRDRQFCNLTEVVVRPDDTFETLARKVRLATILGTLQSTLTDFRYLSAEWKKNCEEERLLGVSLTGIMDHPLLSTPECWDLLSALRHEAIKTNQEWAEKLGINPSTAITCVKPSGTVSQLVDSASGIHPRYSRYYIRTIRLDKHNPVANFLIEQGVPYEPDVMKPDYTWVFSFPIKAPEHAVLRNDISAIDQLNLWLTYATFWCEHKPSITVYVREDEWLDVGAWVYKHWEYMSGVSFLPHSDHVYQQAPYQEITEEQYNQLSQAMPVIDWSKFNESTDNTTATQELACKGGVCELAGD